MNGPWHLYDVATGVFTGATFHCNVDDIEHGRAFARANAPAGMAVYEGHVPDRASQKVNTATGQLTDYQPPPPSQDHTWTGRRWVT